jgi:phosphate transport system substrate-binding protein
MHTSQSNLKGRKTCNHCGYNANPVTAKYCKKCSKPLNTIASEKKDKTAKADFEFPFFWLFLALLFLLFGVGGYFFWQQILPKPEISDRDRTPSDNTSTSDTRNSDIQSYKRMKDVPNVPTGTFNFGGSLIFASLVAQGTHQSITQAHPQFSLRYVDPPDSQPGTGKGIEMLLNGQLSFALSGRPLEDTEYQKATERGFKLDQAPVAIDGLASYTHPGISIPGLSVSQLQDIYTGKITNWKEVGGPDLAIVP